MKEQAELKQKLQAKHSPEQTPMYDVTEPIKMALGNLLYENIILREKVNKKESK